MPGFPRDALAARLAGLRPDAFVFSARRGGVLRSGNFRRGAWNAVCVAVGLGEVVDLGAGKKRYEGSGTSPRRSPDDLDALADRLDSAERAAAAPPRPGRRGNVVPLHAAGL